MGGLYNSQWGRRWPGGRVWARGWDGGGVGGGGVVEAGDRGCCTRQTVGLFDPPVPSCHLPAAAGSSGRSRRIIQRSSTRYGARRGHRGNHPWLVVWWPVRVPPGGHTTTTKEEERSIVVVCAAPRHAMTF
eukprot:CAMPEP_0119473716 /NCGR_PEP_ID=MMETSP1344-20130328/5264_1 /TAXON_ID=236787 /ORGANISM="Florenciella parvula, Strain CCMP2471" /LENGTH=130 /DNA_ID=CAMNT_0007506885 /DNA_START=526 /DNA_END=918 /DNA_ORIENTATION=-